MKTKISERTYEERIYEEWWENYQKKCKHKFDSDGVCEIRQIDKSCV